MSNNTNSNESATTGGERNFESCKIVYGPYGIYQVVNFTKTKVFCTGTYEACYTWILENHQGFSRSVLTKPAPKTLDVTTNKQNSVEWIVNELQNLTGLNFEGEPLIQKAKQMHKEEITDSYIEGHSIYGESTNAEQYYNETYGGQDESK